MSYKISLKSKHIPKKLLSYKIGPKKPIAFHNGKYNNEAGVFILVHQGNNRKSAYFYPCDTIEAEIKGRGGRENYVYREGFDPQKTLETILPRVKDDLPKKWRAPNLRRSIHKSLFDFQITQPGIDIWRMLCFAMDYCKGFDSNIKPEFFLKGEKAHPIFAVHAASGLFLIAGNHRSLFALACGVEEIPAIVMNVPIRAHQYIGSLERNRDDVHEMYQTSSVLALARSFIVQAYDLER
jgi:hypothetical protein